MKVLNQCCKKCISFNENNEKINNSVLVEDTIMAWRQSVYKPLHESIKTNGYWNDNMITKVLCCKHNIVLNLGLAADFNCVRVYGTYGGGGGGGGGGYTF